MKKRLFSFLLMLFLATVGLTVSAGAAEVASGTCGTNLTWSLDADGILTISGAGAMEDYTSGGP